MGENKTLFEIHFSEKANDTSYYHGSVMILATGFNEAVMKFNSVFQKSDKYIHTISPICYEAKDSRGEFMYSKDLNKRLIL